jgi:hypothetical protein
MSTFAVFGMTKHVALADARKSTPTKIAGRELNAEQWESAILRAAEKIMASAKVKQLSPLFDAPQYAEQFIQIARMTGNCRDMKIKAKRVITDAGGKPILNKKTKAPKVGFCEYAAA